MFVKYNIEKYLMAKIKYITPKVKRELKLKETNQIFVHTKDKKEFKQIVTTQVNTIIREIEKIKEKYENNYKKYTVIDLEYIAEMKAQAIEAAKLVEKSKLIGENEKNDLIQWILQRTEITEKDLKNYFKND